MNALPRALTKSQRLPHSTPLCAQGGVNALKLLNDFLVKLGAFYTGFQYLAAITLLWQVGRRRAS